ncbi:DUF1624 domain-containing protein [Nocardioidaceae bacterium]|nr:DUF1624 domain-containing protein [Nocardioidaceae bacterium]
MTTTSPRRSRRPSRPAATGRLVGIDVARWLALIGMIGVHTMPARDADGSLTWVEHAFAGRSSALFAVLLGVSLALMTGGSAPRVGAALTQDRLGIAVRAVLVGAVGLLLGDLESGIAVILAYYAALMVLALPFLGLRAGPLLGLAVTWAVLAPLVSQVVREAFLPPASRLNPGWSMLADPGDLLAELVLSGYYPAFTWLAYALLGVAIGRLPLRRRATQLWLLAVGAVVAVVPLLLSAYAAPAAGVSDGEISRTATEFSGVTPVRAPEYLLLDAPHSGTPFDLLTTAGSAAAAIGVCLLLVSALSAAGAGARRGTAVVFGAGTATLTLYSLHVFLRTPPLLPEDGGSTYALHVLIVSLIGAGLVLAGRRGPLEAATGALPRLLRRRRANR